MNHAFLAQFHGIGLCHKAEEISGTLKFAAIATVLAVTGIPFKALDMLDLFTAVWRRFAGLGTLWFRPLRTIRTFSTITGCGPLSTVSPVAAITTVISTTAAVSPLFTTVIPAGIVATRLVAPLLLTTAAVTGRRLRKRRTKRLVHLPQGSAQRFNLPLIRGLLDLGKLQRFKHFLHLLEHLLKRGNDAIHLVNGRSHSRR